MYCSLPGSPYCPVMSFQNYVRRLHPSNERLWQKPLDSFSENSPVWYCNSGVGEKTLSSFMSRLSKSCGLAQIYTNHSIRATGATILSKNMYGAAQIMAVTGHKSVQSLTTYQRVDTEEKIKMGQTLTENVTPVPEQLALPSTEKLAITAPPTHQDGTSRVLQNLPPGTIVQDLVPVRTNHSVQNVPTGSSFTDYLQGVNLEELLSDFPGNVQNNTCNNTQCNHNTFTRPQLFYGNVTSSIT